MTGERQRAPDAPVIDDTEHCPLGERCFGCRGTEDLSIATFGGDMGVGVFCATVCHSCVESGVDWHGMPIMVAVQAVLAHCGHLGIDLDEMASALARERDS